MADLEELMQAILAYCKEHRGSQSELARYLQVTPQTLCNWLYLRKKPSLDKYLALQDWAQKKRIRRP